MMLEGINALTDAVSDPMRAIRLPDPRAAITIDTRDPRVRQVLLQPQLRRMLALLQKKIDELARQPGATPERVLEGLGDGDALGWAWLVPLLAPLAQNLLGSKQGAESTGIGPSAGTGAGKTDAAGIVGMIQQMMTARGSQQVPGTPPGAFTPEMVMTIIKMVQEKNQQPPGAPLYQVPVPPPPPRVSYAAPPSGPCMPPDVYDAAGGFCYNPIERKAAETAAGTPGAPAAAATDAAAPARRGGSKRKVRKAKSRVRKKRALRGIMVNGIYFDGMGEFDDEFGAPASGGGLGIGGAILVGAGALLAAGGAAYAVARGF